MIIYVMRHGQTDWNAAWRLQGCSDTELNQNGIELARITGEALKEVPFYMAFSSPLKRAKVTAKLALGGRKIPIVEDRRIIEVNFGPYEGLCCFEGHPDTKDPNLGYFFTAPEKYRAPSGGEGFEELVKRTSDFLKDIVLREELEDKTILVATHGAAGKALLNSLQGREVADFWKGGLTPNCGITILESRLGNLRLLEENKTYY